MDDQTITPAPIAPKKARQTRMVEEGTDAGEVPSQSKPLRVGAYERAKARHGPEIPTATDMPTVVQAEVYEPIMALPPATNPLPEQAMTEAMEVTSPTASGPTPLPPSGGDQRYDLELEQAIGGIPPATEVLVDQGEPRDEHGDVLDYHEEMEGDLAEATETDADQAPRSYPPLNVDLHAASVLDLEPDLHTDLDEEEEMEPESVG